MANIYDISTLTLPAFIDQVHRKVLGSDSFFSQFENLLGDSGSFPPYNVEKLSEKDYRLTMAVAGFTKDEISVTVHERTLSIVGTKKVETTEEKRTFIHRGIAERSFRRDFQLTDYVIVTDAEIKDGLLVVSLVRELPEAPKAKVIEIK